MFEPFRLCSAEEEKKMIILNNLNDIIEKLVKERNELGREIQADVFHSEIFAGVEVRLYDKRTTAILRFSISYNSIANGDYLNVLEKAFRTKPFNKPSKLERVLK